MLFCHTCNREVKDHIAASNYHQQHHVSALAPYDGEGEDRKTREAEQSREDEEVLQRD